MSSWEFSGWQAYNAINPFVQGRMDWRFAMLAALVASGFSGKEFDVDDFMFKSRYEGMSEELPGEEEGWETQLRWVEMMNAAFGGSDEREKEELG